MTDPTQIWTGDGRRFYLAPSDLKHEHPDRPTVEQVRQEIARGRYIEGIHYMRTATGRVLFNDIATKVGVGPTPSRMPR